VTIEAQKVTDLVVEQNHLESFANLQENGKFRPRAAIDVSARVVNQGKGVTCGQPPKSPCYVIHYPDRITVKGNTIIQHVRNSLGVQLKYVDASGVDPAPYGVTDNSIEATNRIAPIGTVDPGVRVMGIDVQFGVPPLSAGGAFKEVRNVFQKLSISGNRFRQFADGVRILHTGQVGVKVKSTMLTTNEFNTNLTPPRGMAIEDNVKAPHEGFITALHVDNNKFGCGFSTGPPPPAGLPPQAFVRPSGQAHTGNIGALIPCQGPGVGQQRGDEDTRPPGEAGVRDARP
jgi:hypothetical protein